MDVAIVATFTQLANDVRAEVVLEVGRPEVEGQAEYIPVVEDNVTTTEGYVIRSAFFGSGIDNGYQVFIVVKRQRLR